MATDPRVRIIMLGESGVGKTSLMLRFSKNIFRDDHKCTLIVDHYMKTVFLKDTKIELELWDTAGQEQYKSIVREYFRKADGVCLVYDMTKLPTFMKLTNWLSDLRAINDEATVLIVGNKLDLFKMKQNENTEHPNKVCRSTVEKYARDEGLEFCEASAKENENVDEVFNNLALKVLAKKNIAPFCKEITNGKVRNAAYNSSQHETDSSLPPVIRLQDDNQVIKLTMEKPREKKKKTCC